MKVFRLENMVKGWFVGGFDPSALNTAAAEVAVKTYEAGIVEPRHMQKVAPEVTLILQGRVRMNDAFYSDGDIVLIEPVARLV